MPISTPSFSKMKSHILILFVVLTIGCGLLSNVGDAASVQKRLGKVIGIPKVSRHIKNGLPHKKNIDEGGNGDQMNLLYDDYFYDNGNGFGEYNIDDYPIIESSEEIADGDYDYPEYPNIDSNLSKEKEYGDYHYPDDKEVDSTDDEAEYDYDMNYPNLSDDVDPTNEDGEDSDEEKVNLEKEIYGPISSNETDEDDQDEDEDDYDDDDDYKSSYEDNDPDEYRIKKDGIIPTELRSRQGVRKKDNRREIINNDLSGYNALKEVTNTPITKNFSSELQDSEEQSDSKEKILFSDEV